MAEFVCKTRCFQFGKLYREGDPLVLPDGVDIPKAVSDFFLPVREGKAKIVETDEGPKTLSELQNEKPLTSIEFHTKKVTPEIPEQSNTEKEEDVLE